MEASIVLRRRVKAGRFLLYIACASLMIALMNVGAKLSDKDVAPPQLPDNPAAVRQTLGANPYLRSVAEDGWLLTRSAWQPTSQPRS
jgi:hypothetical protein